MDGTGDDAERDRGHDRAAAVNELQRSASTTFAERVLGECRTAVPLGAYACAENVRYLFLAASGPYALVRQLDAETTLQPVSGTIPLFSWDEREMADEWGVRFDLLPDARPLRGRHGTMPPAITAHGTGLMRFVVGPVHAGIIEPGRFTFSSGGETIVHLDAQLSYAHRGVERFVEGLDVAGAARLVARICGSCSAARSFAYARALEGLAGVDLPDEVELARLAVAELERLYNHLGDLAASAAGAGWGPGFAGGMACKERLCRLAAGHRLLFDAIVPGGIGPQVLRERRRLADQLAAFAADVEEYLRVLFTHASTVSRWQRAGRVSREVADAFGAVGPAHRAAHGKIDVRSFAPYGAYRRLPVRVASATAGDAYARCRVKRDEISESFRLIRDALVQLGDVDLPDPQALAVPPGVATTVVEGPRGSEVLAVHVDGGGRLSRLHVISASFRNWPVVARSVDGNIVPDFPLINKSFNLCYACADR